MPDSTTNSAYHPFHVRQEILISASPDAVFEALLATLGPQGQVIDGMPLPKVLEPWPGGRWFRDLGCGAGHLWGHVQVIKPPTLLEICGPLFMSYPALNHLQLRLTPEGAGTRLTLTHQAFGPIPSNHEAGIPEHWQCELARVRELAEHSTAGMLV